MHNCAARAWLDAVGECQHMHDRMTGCKNISDKYLTRARGVMDVLALVHDPYWILILETGEAQAHREEEDQQEPQPEDIRR